MAWYQLLLCSKNEWGIIEFVAIIAKGMTMSCRKPLTYTICLLCALITIFAGYASSAQATPAPLSGGARPGARRPSWGASIKAAVPFAVDQARWRGARSLLAAVDPGEQPDKLQIHPDALVRLVVDMDQRTLTVLAGQEVVGVYPVAIGKWQTPTPIGEWKIIDKDYNWGGPFGPRWMGLDISWGRYGIHGTNNPGSISYETSLGCLRMFDDDVLQIFDLVKVGTQVDIIGPPHETNLWQRELDTESVGPDVVYAQLALKKKGFYPYRCDGIFGRLTDLGVRCFQALDGLPVTGKIDEKTNRHLREPSANDQNRLPPG